MAIQAERAHVGFDQLDAGQAGSRLFEHRGIGINPDHVIVALQVCEVATGTAGHVEQCARVREALLDQFMNILRFPGVVLAVSSVDQVIYVRGSVEHLDGLPS